MKSAARPAPAMAAADIGQCFIYAMEFSGRFGRPNVTSCNPVREQLGRRNAAASIPVMAGLNTRYVLTKQ